MVKQWPNPVIEADSGTEGRVNLVSRKYMSGSQNYENVQLKRLPSKVLSTGGLYSNWECVTYWRFRISWRLQTKDHVSELPSYQIWLKRETIPGQTKWGEQKWKGLMLWSWYWGPSWDSFNCWFIHPFIDIKCRWEERQIFWFWLHLVKQKEPTGKSYNSGRQTERKKVAGKEGMGEKDLKTVNSVVKYTKK